MDNEYKDGLKKEIEQAREEMKAGLFMTKEQILNQIRKNRVDRENQMLKRIA